MENTKPINIRVSPDLDAKITEAANRAGIPKADLMRVAMTLGIKDLDLINYDIAGAIFDRATKAKEEGASVELKSLPSKPVKRRGAS